MKDRKDMLKKEAQKWASKKAHGRLAHGVGLANRDFPEWHGLFVALDRAKGGRV